MYGRVHGYRTESSRGELAGCSTNIFCYEQDLGDLLFMRVFARLHLSTFYNTRE